MKSAAQTHIAASLEFSAAEIKKLTLITFVLHVGRVLGEATPPSLAPHTYLHKLERWEGWWGGDTDI